MSPDPSRTPRPCARFRYARIAITLALSACASADAAVPHLADAGQEDFRAFQHADEHRAFAIAPGGAYGWVAGLSAPEPARSAALERCRAAARRACVLYAVDREIVLDEQAWTGLWGPYADARTAAAARPGTAIGERFPDLAWTSAAGRRERVEELRGKVVVLHFWASWCGPCRLEMPQVEALRARLADRPDVVLVPLQVRESIDVSRRWASGQGLRLPLADSGATGSADTNLKLAGGGALPDRSIATVFPTTVVLDKRGLVVFTHIGPVRDWREYDAFIRDAAVRSGRAGGGAPRAPPPRVPSR